MTSSIDTQLSGNITQELSNMAVNAQNTPVAVEVVEELTGQSSS